MKFLYTLFFAILFFSFSSQAQQIIKLYPGNVPNSKESNIKETFDQKLGMYRDVINPTLEVFLPEKEKSTGAAVVICPGGGYSVVVYQAEGISTAKEFAKNGIASFVLKYRIPSDLTMIDKKNGPLQDALQAIKIVRENTTEWGIDKNKIGIMGFSAGGHLASTVATHFNKVAIENSNNTNLRPDFQILVYPVISMQDSLTHRDSKRQLLGENPTKEIIDEFSNELRVTENTPLAYITHTGDDKTVDVDNSIRYFEALRHHNVLVELHIHPEGGHGFIFKHKGWMVPLLQWMKDSKIIEQKQF
jgi:acetyl esterase/lipase